MPDPTDSKVVSRLREHKLQLAVHDTVTMTEMAEKWLVMEQQLQGNIATLAMRMAELREEGQIISQSMLFQNQRYHRLLQQVRSEMAQYSKWAEENIANRQKLLGKLGVDHAAEAIQLSISEFGGSVGAYFDKLPVSAIEKLVGIAGDGGPIGKLLRESFPNVADQLTRALLEGTMLGRNPRDVAKDMAHAAGGELNRMMTIARTEQLRAYRAAAQDQYVTSGLVESYRRLAAKNERTCSMCIALDGEEYPTDELMSVHPNDRCTMVPNVAGMPRHQWETGSEWLAKQDPEIQKKILGPGRYDKWKAGEITLADTVVKVDHPVWGPTITQVPLKDLGQVAPVDIPIAPIDQLTEEIRASEVEQMIILDKDGQIMLQKTGGEHEVYHDREERMAIALSQEGDVILHNHPLGGPPSPADLDTMKGFGVDRLRVVTDKEFDYEVSFAPGLAPADKGKIVRKLESQLKPDKVQDRYWDLMSKDLDDEDAEWDDVERKWTDIAVHDSLTEVSKWSKGRLKYSRTSNK
jgi:SPP1 gp7 family putative phage head morphogenesis protein